MELWGWVVWLSRGVLLLLGSLVLLLIGLVTLALALHELEERRTLRRLAKLRCSGCGELLGKRGSAKAKKERQEQLTASHARVRGVGLRVRVLVAPQWHLHCPTCQQGLRYSPDNHVLSRWVSNVPKRNTRES